MSKLSRPYQDQLLEDLKDPEEAASYLDAALEEGSNELFLLALQSVAEAHGIKKLSEQAHLNRESIYQMLSDPENPQLSNLSVILGSLGLRLAIEIKETV